jgi:ribosomal protein S25
MPPAQQVKEKKEMRYQSGNQPDRKRKRKKKAQGRERRMKAVDGDRMVGEVLRRPH